MRFNSVFKGLRNVCILLVFLTCVHHDAGFKERKNKNLLGRYLPQTLLFPTVWGPPLTYRAVGAGCSTSALSGPLIDALKYYKIPAYVTFKNFDCSIYLLLQCPRKGHLIPYIPKVRTYSFDLCSVGFQT